MQATPRLGETGTARPQREREAMTSALYRGQVMHKRLRPFSHRFAYRVFSLYLDLDELPELHRRLRFFSHNRPNLLSFWDKDHGARDGGDLRGWIEGHLAAAGIDLEGGAIRLHGFPRLFGYVFNPLTTWFCHHRSGRLAAILYEVRNTFGEGHAYLIPVDPARAAPGEPVLQACEKLFYVSPFMPMEARYRFRVFVPGEKLSLAIRQWTEAGETLVATHTGARHPLSDRAILSAVAAHPAMTYKVMAGIHWEAARVFLGKRARFHRRPSPPAAPVTLVAQARAKAQGALASTAAPTHLDSGEEAAPPARIQAAF